MMREKDYLAPLDPDLLTAFAGAATSAPFEESADVWALGLLTRHHDALLHLQRGLQHLLRLGQEGRPQG